MFIKIDCKGFGFYGEIYWLNTNRVISFIPREDYTEIIVEGLDDNLKTAEPVIALLDRISVAEEGLVKPLGFNKDIMTYRKG